jgi:signal transduction histidine kinase/CheY-like chemotaxis protein
VIGLADLYRETVDACSAALIALAAIVLAVAALALNSVDGATVGVACGLVAVGALAHHLVRAGARSAALAIVFGLTATFVVALAVLPTDVLAPWMSLVVLVASALLGWRWGIGVCALLALGLAVLAAQMLLDPRIALSAGLLGGAAVFVAWMTTRPTRSALDCASRCYGEAQRAVHELQGRQGELASFGKSLSVSYHLLQQLNLDLDNARKAAHKARQLKAQFAASVSHELRTPLNLIIGFCEMMVLAPAQAYGRRLPPGFRDDLEAIYRNACHLSTLVDDILDLSQVDAARMALQREWTTIGQIVDEAMAPLASPYRDRGLYLRAEMPADLPAVYVDRTRIRQILINLLNNAARFTDEGGVVVSARTEGRAGVVVAVTDTGPGIAPDDLRYVFQEFHQFGDAQQRRGGSGLGLAVSKAFAELHQGSLSIESTPGVGSTFSLSLPIGDPTLGDQAASPPLTNRVRPGPSGQLERRILIVDRSGQIARVFRRYLDGMHVMHLRDLRPTRNGDPVLMPHAVIVGSRAEREHWRRTSASMPQWQRVPVLLCPLKTAQRQADELGVRDYLVKPVTRAQLRSVLLRVCPRPERVLLVEDDPEMQRLLARMLRSIAPGCEVHVAGDGAEALEVLHTAEPPEVILLDLLLPRVDGYAVLEGLRRDARLTEVPVIVVSARGAHSESMLAHEFAVECEGGLTVSDVMVWIKSGLEALVGPAAVDTSARADRAAIGG